MDRTVKYVPKVFVAPAEDGVEKVRYTGHLEIKIPRSTERMAWVTEAGCLDITEGETPSSSAKTQLALYQAMRGHIVKVEVKAADGREINSLDDLELEEDLKWLPLELGKKVLQGFGPGNG